MFEYCRFIERINYECNHARVGIDSQDRCLAMCVVQMCFVKNSDSDENSPCWVEIVSTQAVDYVHSKSHLSHDIRTNGLHDHILLLL